MSIPLIQKHLKKEKLDGWLFYDFHGKNPLLGEIFGVPPSAHITRRFFYWVPAEGEPIKVVHKIEACVLDALPGITKLYGRREELSSILKNILHGTLAMETSSTLPQLSFVDAGTLDFVKEQGVEVCSSAVLVQKTLSLLSEEQQNTQREAGIILDKIVGEAFAYVQERKEVYEGEVQKFILQRIAAFGCSTKHTPIVARGANSASPHYSPQGKGDRILPGDFLLLDLWCKKKGPHGVYADITRVRAPKNCAQEIKEAFFHVREAQKIAVRYIEEHTPVRGADVDTAARTYLEKQGYKENILHRLGHSIDAELHGRGANLDSFESLEERILLPNTCYSIEPALYFPGQFGLRLEHDILYLGEGKVEVTGGVQETVCF